MENIQEILIQLPNLLALGCQVVGAVCLAATAIAKMTKTKSDDKAVGKVVGKILDLLSWLPTIGINPRTKKLEEEIKSLKQ